MSLAVQKPDQAWLAYVSLAVTMDRKTSRIRSSLMPCARSTRRPYRVLPQDSTSVSTCRFIESWLVMVMPRALMLVTRWMFGKVGGSTANVPRLPRALKIISNVLFWFNLRLLSEKNLELGNGCSIDGDSCQPRQCTVQIRLRNQCHSLRESLALKATGFCTVMMMGRLSIESNCLTFHCIECTHWSRIRLSDACTSHDDRHKTEFLNKW